MRKLTYQVSTGTLRDAITGVISMTAYSGHGEGLNNPEFAQVHNVGPIPAGVYTLDPPIDPSTHLGPFAFPLIPSPGNEMFGREGFYMHGDNALMNHSASDGCIILPYGVRQWIARVLQAEPLTLEVIA